jgi:hypothetical protein
MATFFIRLPWRRLSRTDYLANGGCIGFPGPGFGAKMTTALAGQVVILRLPVVVREAPFAFNEAFAFEAPQGGIESALFNEKGIIALVPDQAGAGIAMQRSPHEGFKDKDIEGPAYEFETSFLHACLLPLEFMGSMPHFPSNARETGNVDLQVLSCFSRIEAQADLSVFRIGETIEQEPGKLRGRLKRLMRQKKPGLRSMTVMVEH